MCQPRMYSPPMGSRRTEAAALARPILVERAAVMWERSSGWGERLRERHLQRGEAITRLGSSGLITLKVPPRHGYLCRADRPAISEADFSPSAHGAAVRLPVVSRDEASER